MQQTIHAELYVNNEDSLLYQLIKDFSSCRRNSYNRFKRDEMSLNDVRKHEKLIYPNLNVRQICDAVLSGQQIFTRFKDKKIIFGGRTNFKKLKRHYLSNEEWQFIRDNQIYSRGDKSRSGNINTRIISLDNNRFQLRITIGFRKFEFYDLLIPKKYQQIIYKILDSGIAYNVRIMQKSTDKFDVNIDFKVESAPVIGRRALGYSEKVSLYSYPAQIVKENILRTLEEKYEKKIFHEWSYWRVNYHALKGSGFLLLSPPQGAYYESFLL